MIEIIYQQKPTSPVFYARVTEEVAPGRSMSMTGYGPSQLAAVAHAYSRLFLFTARKMRETRADIRRCMRSKQQADHRARVLAQVQARRAAA